MGLRLRQKQEVEKKELITQSCPTLHDPMDCSLPGSSLHGILQARILEWIAKINMIVTWLKSQFSHPDKDQIKLMRLLGIHRPKSRRRIIVRGPRKWQPIPVFLPRESHGQRNLVAYSPWGHEELDMIEQLTVSLSRVFFGIN